MNTVLIEFTKEQQDAILPLLMAMKEGEATFAQVYLDGMRVRYFDIETVKRIQVAIGTADESTGLHRYAADAQEMTEIKTAGMTPNAELTGRGESGGTE